MSASESPRASSRDALSVAMGRLSSRIRQSGARIVPHALPIVSASPAELATLFELLLSVSLRAARGTPEIWVSALARPQGWEFALRDVSVGSLRLDERSQKEFERCRSLLQRRGGKLWTDDGEGVGTTIRFTVPDRPAG